MTDIAKLQTVLTPVFRNYGISRAVLFGSVAKKTATDKSDLDLLVTSYVDEEHLEKLMK